MIRQVVVLLALAAASASAFLTPGAPNPRGPGRVVRHASQGQVSRQQQLGGMVQGLGLAGLGTAFLAGWVGSPV